MPLSSFPPRAYRRACQASAPVLLLCAAAACATVPAPSSGPLPPGRASAPVTSSDDASRALRWGNVVQGTLAARGDADDYTIQVEQGQHFTAVLEVPPQRPESQLHVQVYRQHPVTAELNHVKANFAGSGDGERAATEPFATEAGLYVVRVKGMDGQYGGRYALRVLPTAKGTVALGQTVQGELDGRGDADDYVLTVPAGTRLVGRLEVPFTGKETSLQLYLYRRDPVTGELHFEKSVIVDSTTGQPGATSPVTSSAGGTYVARVQGMDLRYGGRYAITVERP